MNYTDKKLIRASQIAYFKLNDQVMSDIDRWIEILNGIQKPNYTLSELYEHSQTFRYSIYDSITKCIDIGGYVVNEYSKREDVLSFITDEKTKQRVLEKFDIIDDIVNGEIGKWKVVSYVDNNTIGKEGMAGKLVDGKWDHQKFSKSGDGLAAVVFETGDGQAITAFRGSEGPDDILKNRNDLVTERKAEFPYLWDSGLFFRQKRNFVPSKTSFCSKLVDLCVKSWHIIINIFL